MYALKKAYLLERLKYAILVSGVIQSIIAASQFIKNASIGIRLLGESSLGPNIDGVAKIYLFGVKHIRSYGTFPHPNILAGFLIIPIIIVIDSLRNKIELKNKTAQTVSHETRPISYVSETKYALLILILLCGLLLTFSRSAYLGLIIGLILYFTKFLNLKMLYKKHCFKLCILLFTSIILLISLWETKPHSIFSSQSMHERDLYYSVSREIINTRPLIGFGIGQFVYTEYMFHGTLPGWQYQPVHNAYLLIISEIGMIGFIIFLLSLIILVFRKINRSENPRMLELTYYVFCIIICFAVISIFDHYFWDIEQGQLIFFIPFLLISLV